MQTLEKPTHVLYFAYGSNMSPEQIGERCAKPEFLATARLPGHRVGFFGHSKTWDGAQATVIPDKDTDVWGAVYRLSVSDMDRLDNYQDVRIDGTGAYFDYPAEVVDGDGTIHSVILYKKDILGESLPPSKPYLDRILAGARMRKLPEDYVETFGLTSSKEPSYEVPKQGNAEMLFRVNTACEGCG
jgi:gamma-glutamylcyclotransferase (GGCT)/AIG2-like uncharacterized protein YtfP